jgi:hypothetical protein
VLLLPKSDEQALYLKPLQGISMSRLLTRIAVSALSLLAAVATAGAAEQPREIRVDYAYYSPPSLVLKRFGWLEQEFKADNIPSSGYSARAATGRSNS